MNESKRSLYNSLVIGCFTFLFLLGSQLIESASFDKPHSHQGKVSPFEPKAPSVKLDSKALATLDNGDMFKTQIMDGSSGRGLVVLDVHGPTDTVWSRILDYNNYAKMVSGCTSSKNYNVIQHKPSKSNNYLSQTIYTRMKIGLSMVQLEYFIKHSYHPKLNVLTWTLDYTKRSDLDDSVGYWYVIKHPTKGQSWSRVYYSVDVAIPNWLPKFVKDFFSTKALTDATAWVKRESEKVALGSDGDKNKKGEGKQKKGKWRNKKNTKKDESDIGCDSETCESSSVEREATAARERPSARRASLIFLVFTLFLYNVGLFLERISSN